MDMKTENTALTGMEIAVTGMSGRFPGAADIPEFWENLKKGRETISFLSEEEMITFAVDEESINHPGFVKAGGGILGDIKYFDASFFGCTPREAELMDPQMRIFHECAYEALENAGCNPGTYNGSIGLFAGASPNIYWQVTSMLSGKSREYGEFETGLLINRDFFCTRISYNLDLKGPSMTVQTACSTSLTAVHLACQAILNGECHMALAGGVAAANSGGATAKGYVYHEGMILSPDGHCRAFDARAKGTIYGEGCGIVVLKSLENALEDRDHILGVIKGTAVNNDGKSKVGYTAPSVAGQANAIRIAMQVAEVEPESIGYIESHGTGTELGDLIEIQALESAFKTSKKGFCGIGSVKTNIGHLDAAAGAAGLIKTLLALQHKEIPASLHFETGNAKIDFGNSPFYVVHESTPWHRQGRPLRAGVSSFGIGGTNAHVVLEEYKIEIRNPKFETNPNDQNSNAKNTPPGKVFGPIFFQKGGPPEAEETVTPQLILLSAKTESALDKMTGNLAHHLEHSAGISLPDAAYTLRTGRKEFPYRRICVCRDKPEAVASLSSGDGRKLPTAHCIPGEKNVVFMFSGLGAQYVNMGLGLYRSVPLFRQTMEQCFEILKPLVEYDMKEILYPASSPDYRRRLILENPGIAQAAVFIFEYALSQLLLNWGIKPGAVIGYSFGEYSAACLSGVFSLPDALKLIVHRGKLVNSAPPGAMVSVPAPADEVMPFLNDELSIAVDNGPSCIAAGSAAAVAAFEKAMKERKYLCVPLDTPRAVHSKMMEPVLKEFAGFVGEMNLKQAAIPYISNVTGDWIEGDKVTGPAYWARHLRETVRFAEGINKLMAEGDSVFIEIGPGHDLSVLLKHHVKKETGHVILNMARYEQEKTADEDYLLNRVGRLWLSGVAIDWHKVYPQGWHSRNKVPLPTYPFERQEYWLEDDFAGSLPERLAASSGTAAPLRKEKDISKWFYRPSWQQSALAVNSDIAASVDRYSWLVFMDEGECCAGFVHTLRQYKQDPVIVRIGARFEQPGERSFHIDPVDSGGYEKLFAGLPGSSKKRSAAPAHGVPQDMKQKPWKIIHFWGITNPAERSEELTVETAKTRQDLGLFSLLYVAQALGKSGVSNRVDIEAVTGNMLEITGGDCLYPGKAALLGAVKVIPLEYFNINCRSVDLAAQDLYPALSDKLIEKLMIEFTAGAADKVVGYRGHYRWLQRFDRVYLDKNHEGARRIREKGVYLITGGLGGMGLEIARFLAAEYRARLILINRSPFLPRQEWQEWTASHDGDDGVCIKIAKLREIERSGGAVSVFSADAGNYEEMKQAVTRGEAEFGRISGVIHAAGIIDFNGVIQRRTRQMTEENLAPKVTGTLVLDTIFKERTLDFMALFSSIGNVLYGAKFGQTGYNAANEFLDAYAYYNPGKHKCKITVNWSDWHDVGMAIKALSTAYKNDPDRLNKEILSLKNRALSPAEGVEAFRILLSRSFPRLVVSLFDLEEELRRMNRKLQDAGANIEKGIIAEQNAANRYDSKPGLDTAYAAPRSETEEKIVDIWRNFFGYREIGINDDFFALGGNSLSAINIISKINKRLSIEMPLSEFFNVPTVAGISAFIDGKEERQPGLFIRAVEKRQYYSLFPGQKRLYILQELEKNSLNYNDTRLFLLTGSVDRKKLHAACEAAIKRHEIFRTSIRVIADEPVQVVHAHVPFTVEYYESAEEKAKELAGELIEPFDLSKAPLFRIRLIGTARDRFILIIDAHHIITDGISNVLFVKEWLTLYRGEGLPPVKFQYRDFVAWEKSRAAQDRLKEQEEYWLNLYTGGIPAMDLPVDFPRPVVRSFAGSSIDFAMPDRSAQALREFSAESGTTLFVILLAAFNILLAKLANREDMVVGTPVTGRRHEDLENMPGMFVKTLALRNFPKGDKTFGEFLAEVKASTVEAFANQDYPFEKLVERVAENRDMSHNPLFDVMFVSDYADSAGEETANLATAPYKLDVERARFDIVLTAVEGKKKIAFKIEYCTALFKKETIEIFIRRYLNIIDLVSRHPGINISGIDILSEEEKKRLLYDFNETQAGYSLDRTLHRLFADQAEKTPDSPAVIHGDYTVTYGELNERSAHLAAILKKKGITPGTIAGVMSARSIDTVTGMFGILKAGGAYLPIDPHYPEQRKRFMLRDSNTRFLLVSLKEEDAALSGLAAGIEIIDIKDFHDNHDHDTRAKPEDVSNPGDPVYLIYTSGSTGRPRGAVLDHRSAVNTLLYRKAEYGLGPGAIALQLFSYAFDGFVTGFFTPVISGGRVVLLDREEIADVSRVREAIVKNRVTHFICVPALYKVIIKDITPLEAASLQAVTLAGDRVTPDLIEKTAIKNPNMEVAVEYGVTEAAVMSTLHRRQEKNNTIKIGKPTGNTTAYILNKDNMPLPAGVPGELFVGGAGLARGYLNNPELTYGKFIYFASGGQGAFLKNRPLDPHKTFDEGHRPGFPSYGGVPRSGGVGLSPPSTFHLIYKTGDLARWLANGSIEFLGRKDYQVKIRGFRIELGEIENRLQSHEAIEGTIVLARESGDGQKYLCAYIVSRDEVSLPELRTYVSKYLPGYMLPSYFVQVESIPLTAHGKIDRKALPRPEVSLTGSYAAPANEIEEKLAVVWSEILDIKRNLISTGADFFMLGGHSLKATMLISRIHKELNVKIDLPEFFKAPTIQALSRYIYRAKQEKHRAVELVEKQEYYPLSSAQQRLFNLYLMAKDNTGYNITQAVVLAGPLDRSRLASVFKKLISRHEILRTSIIIHDGIPGQKVHENVEFEMDYYDPGEEKGAQDTAKNIVKPFDLSKAPLFRVGMIGYEGNHILIIDMHHIITDVVSARIFIRDTRSFYYDKELPALKYHYRDYARWQHDLKYRNEMKKQEKYWLERFAGDIPLLDLPTDYPRPAVMSFAGDVVEGEVSEGLTRKLKELAVGKDVTLYMIILAAYNILLSKYSNREDIIVGSSLSGRHHTDFREVMGMFVNTLPIRNMPGSDFEFAGFLTDVKKNILDAMANQDFQFNDLVAKLGFQGILDRNPLFNVVFEMNYRLSGDINENEKDKETLEILPFKLGHRTTVFDLILIALDDGDIINLSLVYSSVLFKREKAKKMLEHIIEILEQVVNSPGIRLADVSISHRLSRVERNNHIDEGDFIF